MATEAQAGWRPDPYGYGSWRWWDGEKWDARTAPLDPGRAGDFAPLRGIVGGPIGLHYVDGEHAELTRHDSRFGTLERYGWGSGIGHCAEGSWRFERPTGSESYLVHVLPSEVEVARFAWGGGGIMALPGERGALSFPDGRVFPLDKTANVHGRSGGLFSDLKAMASADWTMITAARAPLLRSTSDPASSILGHEQTRGPVGLEVYPQAAEMIEFPLLVLLGTFVVWGVTRDVEAQRRNRARWD